MPKPDYAALFAQLETETDPVIREQLLEEVYTIGPPFPIPEGETYEDYLLTPHEKELFAYLYDDYVVDNPGYGDPYVSDTATPYVITNYVVDGYINIENTYTSPYVLDGYVLGDYITASGGSTYSGYIAYVGEYWNSNGEIT